MRSSLLSAKLTTLLSRFQALSQNCEERLLTSSCLFFCLSARYNSAPTEMILMKFDICVFLKQTLEQFKVSLKSDKNNGHFT